MSTSTLEHSFTHQWTRRLARRQSSEALPCLGEPVHCLVNHLGLERTTYEVQTATASQILTRLAAFDIEQLPDALTPFLAAAGAEIALVADIRWRFSADNATVSLLRLISRGSLAKPDATGPHIQRLFEQLEQLINNENLSHGSS